MYVSGRTLLLQYCYALTGETTRTIPILPKICTTQATNLLRTGLGRISLDRFQYFEPYKNYRKSSISNR